MPDTAPQAAWRALGSPTPAGKTGATYRFEPCDGRCCTCGASIKEGIPFEPRRGVAGINNPTFTGFAEFARWGTHVCRACAWFYGDPKRTHRGILAVGDEAWWPLIGAKPDPTDLDRPRWRSVLGRAARAPADTPLTGLLTTDTKPRLWPRMTLAVTARPELYVHAPDQDWSRVTPFDWLELAGALALCDAARALGATKSAIWSGLLASPKLCDKAGVRTLVEIDRRIAPLRGSRELLIAMLVA